MVPSYSRVEFPPSDAVATRDQRATSDLLLIRGGPLQRPIDVTDPDQLRNFDPWTGSFVNWNEPAAMGHCTWEYEVAYFKRGIEPATPYDKGDLRMIYGLRYCFGDDGEPDYVHLAGQTDKFWPENVHIGWNGTPAGKWHPSTLSWKAFIERMVAGQERGQ